MESWLSHTVTNFRAQELKRGPMGEDYYDKSALKMREWGMHNRADRGYMRKKLSGGTKKLHNGGEMKETAHQEVAGGGERDNRRRGRRLQFCPGPWSFFLW